MTDTIIINEVDRPNENIYVSINESTGEASVGLAKGYEVELAQDLIILEDVKARIAQKNEEIKTFLESQGLGSFKTDMLNIKYTSATTQTSVDTTRLKAERPEIAAQYSKTVPKASSVSIKVITD